MHHGLYTYRYKKVDGNLNTIDNLTAKIENDFIEADLLFPNEIKRQGVGSTILDDVLKFYQAKGTPFKGIRGHWERNNPNYVDGMSDNYKTYIEARKTIDIEQAAFKTWTGIQAKKYGYNKAKLLGDESGDVILIEFYK